MKNPHLVRLSAYIAHLLNDREADGRVRPSPHALWASIRSVLAFGQGGAYREHVAGARLMGLCALEEDAEEAAERWMEGVLNRPLQVHPGKGAHKAHALLEALARRAPGCGQCRIILSDAPQENAAYGTPPPGLRRVAARLADLHHEAPDGSNIALSLGDWRGPVPQTLSIWGALSAAPAEMRALPRQTWPDLRNLTTAALENAHVRWGRAVACGVSPWDHDLTANQSKTLKAFLRRLSQEGPPHTAPQARMKAAWRAAPVSRHPTLEAFLGSPLGRDVLSNCPAPTFSPFDDAQSARAADDANAPLRDVAQALDLLTRSGALSPYESRLIARVAQGASLQDIAREPWARRAFGRGPALARYVERLSARLIPAARRLLEEA